MTPKSLAAAACLSICTATAGLAATVTVDGNDDNISTITGAFDANKDLLMDQLWWGDETLARTFAIHLEFSLGKPSGHGGPNFAFGEFSHDGRDYVTFTGYYAFPFRSPGTAQSQWQTRTVTTWAIAKPVSAVPLPAGGLLLLTAFGGVAALKRRTRRAT